MGAFTRARVHWMVTVTRRGDLLAADPLYQPPERGPDGRPIRAVLGAALAQVAAVGPRNNGSTPGFLVDTLDWLFGYAPQRGHRLASRVAPPIRGGVAAARYQRFRAGVLALEAETDDPGVAALCVYYRARPEPEPDLFVGFDEADEEPQPSQRACFAYPYTAGAPATPVHQAPAVVALWQARWAARRG